MRRTRPTAALLAAFLAALALPMAARAETVRVGYWSSGVSLGFGARVSLVAESLGASSGIGYRLRQAADLVQTDQVFAWTLTLVVLMLGLESLILKPLERHLFAWKKSVA